MFDNKFLITLVGLIVAVVAINNIKSDDDEEIKEEYTAGMPQLTWWVDRVAAQDTKSAQKGDFYSVPGYNQSLLSPRFSNLDYGANIRYNMPSYQNQAVPANALTFNNMVGAGGANYVKEKYEGPGGRQAAPSSGNPPNCGKGGYPESYVGGAPMMQAGYANGDYNKELNMAYSNSKIPASTAMLPINDMTSMASDSVNSAPVVYDRYVYSNRNSRLRGLGDPIRGDVPVVPCASGWFRPSVHPNIDLQQGAMNVMGGATNDTANSLANLIYTTSGNGQTSIGGINMNKTELALANNVAKGISPLSQVNMNNQFSGGISAMSDINVTGFV